MSELGKRRPDGDEAIQANRTLKRHLQAGAAVLLIGLGGLVLWAFGVTLQGAVIAPGQFVVASEVKKVQHPSGGIVAAILTREGAVVREGDLLLRLDDTAIRASVQVLSRELFEYAVRSSRLVAERDEQPSFVPIAPPQIVLSPEDREAIIAGEARLFASRAGLRRGQRALVSARIEQVREEGKGLEQQVKDREIERQIVERELQNLRALYRERLVELSRVTAKERERANLIGQINALTAQVAQSRNRFAELQLQLAQIREDILTEVTGQLRDIQAKQGEAVEKLTAAQDQLRRTEIRATAAGTVHRLIVHTVGGVLQAGEVAMQIVPGDDELQVDVRIQPTDIDQVQLHQQARIKVQAGQQSRNPELIGEVVRVAANVSVDDRTLQPYYLSRISVSREEARKLGETALLAGMQAEAFIQTTTRRPIDFLTKPLTDNLARSMRER
jgi:HlyD family secretion protein